MVKGIRLMKGYTIVTDTGITGKIKEMGMKNNRKTVTFVGKFSGWCYRERIIEVYKPDGTKIL